MRFLPLYFDLTAGPLLLVGGGVQALAKLRLLQAAGAKVRWYVLIHLTFIISGVCVAAMDWIEEKSHKVASDKH